ncbi:hypothetical protein HA402_014511 [Bradysia odoriphaga]|nr:hypothetical protein HA402_014511 [Bradysia odoriphaga]
MKKTTVLYLSIVIFSTITQGANTLSPCDESSWIVTDCVRSLQENILLLQDRITNLAAQINLQSLQLNETRKNVIDLQNNSVPIGFIYVQLSAQSEPHHLWPDMTWSDISSQYAGLFFRVLGGGSAQFNVTQNESSPRISQAESGSMTGRINSVNIPSNNWSFTLTTGKQPLPLINPWGIRLFQTADEVRPRNRAVRIWQRIN